jgi:hypothetical protein
LRLSWNSPSATAPSPKKTGGDAVALLHLLCQRQADGERQPATDDRVAAVEASRSVEQMHRPAAPVAAAFGFAIHLGHNRIHRHAAGESMAVLAIGRDHPSAGAGACIAPTAMPPRRCRDA